MAARDTSASSVSQPLLDSCGSESSIGVHCRVASRVAPAAAGCGGMVLVLCGSPCGLIRLVNTYPLQMESNLEKLLENSL